MKSEREDVVSDSVVSSRCLYETRTNSEREDFVLVIALPLVAVHMRRDQTCHISLASRHLYE